MQAASALQYLVSHQWALIHSGLSLLLVASHYVSSVPHIILQQPFEGLTFVLAKLNHKPAQYEPIIGRVPSLRYDAGLRFSLHFFWLLHTTSSSS